MIGFDLYDLGSLTYCFNGGACCRWNQSEVAKKVAANPSSRDTGPLEPRRRIHVPHRPAESPQEHREGRPKQKINIVHPDTLERNGSECRVSFSCTLRGWSRQYWNKPEETAQAFIEAGTGSCGIEQRTFCTMDQDGHLYFVDRTVDTIEAQGYRISSSEVQAVHQDNRAVTVRASWECQTKKWGKGSGLRGPQRRYQRIHGVRSIKWCRE